MRTKISIAIGAVIIAVAGLNIAQADTFGLGQAAGYSAFILPGGSINMDINGGAAIVGDAAVSAGSHLDLGSSAKVGPMAGTGQVVDGNIYLDTISDPQHPATVKLQNQDPNSVHDRDLSQAVNDAFAANQANANLPATQTFGDLDITGPFAIIGNGGLNVIDLNSINLHSNGLLTITGGPSDRFIFNLSASYTQSGNANVVLAGGVQPQDILWNFVGSGNAPNIAGPGNTSTVGIFLAPYRSFSITDVTLNGSVIAAGDLKIGSQALIVPEMSATNALLLGLGLLLVVMRLRGRARFFH